MSSAQLTPKVTTKIKRRADVHKEDQRFVFVLRVACLLVLALFAGVTVQLFRLSLPAISHFGLSFLSGKDWNPVSEQFGSLSFVYGTLVSSLLALLFAVPVSVGVALFLTEVAPRGLASALSFLVEMLAAIPSVVYGLWGIFVLAPLLRQYVEPFLGRHLGFVPLFEGAPFGVGMLCASLILAIMITPTISAICREVFMAISMSQREAALALGATRWEMIRIAVLRGGRGGVCGAVILGLGRALGETMAVTMVIGNRPQISASLFAPAQTMASVIANEYAEATSELHLSSLAAIGLVLFVVSFVINVSARTLVNRFDRSAR
jgi:phosphate transport system permease protein